MDFLVLASSKSIAKQSLKWKQIFSVFFWASNNFIRKTQTGSSVTKERDCVRTITWYYRQMKKRTVEWMNGKNVLFTNTAMFEMTMTTVFFKRNYKKNLIWEWGKMKTLMIWQNVSSYIRTIIWKYVLIDTFVFDLRQFFFLEYFSQKLFEWILNWIFLAIRQIEWWKSWIFQVFSGSQSSSIMFND